MFFMNASIIIFGLFFLLIMLTAFYVWRRINGLESYNKILEKKVNHLKKDNKELREILYGAGEEETCNAVNDADIIMNKIFNADILCVSSAPNQVHNVEDKANTTKITCNDDKCELQDTSDIVQNIIADSIETEVVKPKPVAAMVVQTEQDNDIESVISDAVNGGTYNRKKLTKMNLDKLKEICVSMHLSTEGTKTVLIDKILSNLTIE
jgi:hypothetical protein